MNKPKKSIDVGYVGMNEAAEFFDMSPHTLRKQLHAGLLPEGSYLKTGRNWVFDVSELGKHYTRMASATIGQRLNG